jgi:hypothetical protein
MGGARMRPFVLALLVAPLLLLPFAASARHASRAAQWHSVSTMPGLSMTIPDGWAACDGDTNRALGNPGHVAPIDHLCATSKIEPGDLLLASFNEAMPILLTVHREEKSLWPSAMYVGAPPEVLEGVGREVCKHSKRDGHDGFVDCSVHTLQVDGRVTFFGDGTVAGHPDRAVQYFEVTTHYGAMTFTFDLRRPTNQATLETVRAIMASVRVTSDPPPPEGTVTLNPVPGLSLAVPKTWLACDDATNALFGNANDPYALRRQGCDAHPPEYEKLRVVALEGNSAQFVGVTASPAQGNTTHWTDALTDSALAASRDHDCAYIAERASSGATPLSVSDCATAAGTVAGYPAKIVSFKATQSDADSDLTYHSTVRSAIFVANGQIIDIVLCATSIVEPAISDGTEAVLASVAIQ